MTQPFDIYAATQGEAFATRDGRPASLLRANYETQAALVSIGNKPVDYTFAGRLASVDPSEPDRADDLVMVADQQANA